ncbi:Hypothetical Protein XCAW_01039 [Xanthomonas citri subsp. citri Aw12879]|nr:Hypothetical Protein XCAW_01039 [Xanthomonas citri subsp. citri Aw12879]CEE74609.1 hypothetical protein XAC3218_1120007 [Xanthomonas citri pv. citri]CEH83534.1 hypothetical protein XACB302_10730016 [Xanthomonas citri pv. citri]
MLVIRAKTFALPIIESPLTHSSNSIVVRTSGTEIVSYKIQNVKSTKVISTRAIDWSRSAAAS